MLDKIRDEAHALECLAAANQAGLTPARWAAAHDIHPRSLHGWEEKLHVVQEHQRRRVVKRTTVRCRNCLRRTTSDSLPAPYERSKVTCDWLAWFVMHKFYLLVPLDRVCRLLALQGVSLSMGTLVGFVARAADALAPSTGNIGNN
jgi:hypothetical protein